MEQEISNAINVLLRNGIIDTIEAERDPNYLPWLMVFYFQARAEAARLFGF